MGEEFNLPELHIKADPVKKGPSPTQWVLLVIAGITLYTMLRDK